MRCGRLLSTLKIIYDFTNSIYHGLDKLEFPRKGNKQRKKEIALILQDKVTCGGRIRHILQKKPNYSSLIFNSEDMTTNHSNDQLRIFSWVSQHIIEIKCIWMKFFLTYIGFFYFLSFFVSPPTSPTTTGLKHKQFIWCFM